MASSDDGAGYAVMTAFGKLFAYGDFENAGDESGTLNQPIVGMAAMPVVAGYWLVAGRRRHLLVRRRPVLRIDGRPPAQQADRGHGRHPHRPRLLDGGRRRRHLLLRRRPVLRIDGRPAAQPAHRGHGRHTRPARATGWWPPTAASSRSATPRSTDRWAARPLNKPIVGMAATPDRPAATGWWRPTAASSRSATPPFYGSMGGQRAQPADRGHGRPAPGQGYWLVARDGGIFAFGAPVLRRRPLDALLGPPA